jgi:hypothetical protein
MQGKFCKIKKMKLSSKQKIMNLNTKREFNETKKTKQSETFDKYANQDVLQNVTLISDEYFTNPTGQPNKSFVLMLPDLLAQQANCDSKKLLIRYKVLKRNRHKHKELVEPAKGIVVARRSRSILNRALYNADTIEPCNAQKTSYRMLVSFKDPQSGKNSNAVATVNTVSTENPNYVEIIDWYSPHSV